MSDYDSVYYGSIGYIFLWLFLVFLIIGIKICVIIYCIRVLAQRRNNPPVIVHQYPQHQPQGVTVMTADGRRAAGYGAGYPPQYTQQPPAYTSQQPQPAPKY